MTIKVGINGFGRIGRSIFRASKLYKEFETIEIEAINDLTNTHTLAHILKYDSVMRTFPHDVKNTDRGIIVDGKDIRITAIKEPSQLPWQEMGVEYVIEATGRFSDADLARGHLEAGAQKVVITAPAKHEDVTIVMGVNEDDYDPASHHIVSNASCTTNCLAPVAKVILDRFGIVSGLITTVHAYTNDQRLLDFPHSDLRRARAAAVNMIPTKTGAAAAVSKVIPELTGKFDGLAVRVPTPDVSIVDLVAQVEKRATVSEINETIKAATNRFLGYTDEPLVSTDFMGDPRSSIVDGECTKVIGDNLIKVMSWYDNEWGYSNRILDLILHMNAHKAL
ncbi:MAG: type I glyceraldehyde-3-phosphate dehydrogenase [Deltaproteobacteria bacterium]|nr:type I glyceraldehyde-3-phosphate dehydrogenase [Deltaproteobacteria bacterium]MBW1719020.1 type I glyceraldehyde-3-phosphate dehydrogenase [Deltaproteobacteria bacterium]MBW1932441.1 type I glyceraldehyde-3-phosphate dehydrogenase [Deltaproteobacteria bacterium]MBW1937784.1 type I glyceraldehyde-3-phosphate dehydrogenase [Deltaproteobacteria bacterium]MBW1963919.1 type I glyceraldehyde-3-phosphate dehydrogenase [Deltaproteobacteria bacterium]